MLRHLGLLAVTCAFLCLHASQTSASSIYMVMTTGHIGVYDATTGDALNLTFADTGSATVAGVTFDNHNHMFVTDYSGGRVMEFNATTGELENANLITGIPHAWGITADNQCNLYVASPDTFGGSVAKFSVSGTTATTINMGFIQGLTTIESLVVDSHGNLFTGSYYYLAKWDADTGGLIAYNNPGSFKEGIALYENHNTVFTQNYGLGVYEYYQSDTSFTGRAFGPAVGTAEGSLAILGDTLYSATGGTMQTYDLLTNTYTNTNFVSGPIYNRFVLGPDYHPNAAVPEPHSIVSALIGMAMIVMFKNRRIDGNTWSFQMTTMILLPRHG